MLFKTVYEGERAIIINNSGEKRLISGPARVRPFEIASISIN